MSLSHDIREKKVLRRHLLVYDDDCGACLRFKRTVSFLDSFRRLEFVSLADAEQRGLLDGIPPVLRFRSFHVISPHGRVSSGADAVPEVLSLLPTGGLVSRVVTSVPGSRRAVGFAYGTLSRLHDTGKCTGGSAWRTAGRRRTTSGTGIQADAGRACSTATREEVI